MTSLTAKQYLRRAILRKAVQLGNIEPIAVIDSSNVDALFDQYSTDWHLQDATNECRHGVETGLASGEWSRHYESYEVAAQMEDGQWVGWTYWHGGGKFGNPEGIDWIEGSYLLDCVEEEKKVVVRNFSKREQP